MVHILICKNSYNQRGMSAIFLADHPRSISKKMKYGQTGIPEEYIAYLFDPFYRVDKSRSKKTDGYGLGFSLCKKIMQAHGGRIEIINNEERGTTVKLTFLKS